VLQALLSAADCFDTLATPEKHRLRRLIRRHSTVGKQAS
jgi:hypothetical protein